MRPIKNDLTGERFGRLTVLGRVIVDGRTKWECQCDCGNVCMVDGSNLIYGNTRSCGCYRRDRLKEIHSRPDAPPGTRYGRLTLISVDGKFATVQCDCGTRKTIDKKHLYDGSTNSCGCYRRERMSEMSKARAEANSAEAHNK